MMAGFMGSATSSRTGRPRSTQISPRRPRMVPAPTWHLSPVSDLLPAGPARPALHGLSADDPDACRACHASCPGTWIGPPFAAFNVLSAEHYAQDARDL